MDAQIVLYSTALFQQGVKSKEPPFSGHPDDGDQPYCLPATGCTAEPGGTQCPLYADGSRTRLHSRKHSRRWRTAYIGHAAENATRLRMLSGTRPNTTGYREVSG